MAASEAPERRRIPWPRFDVVQTRWAGEARVRWLVMDYQTKQPRFPLDPFNKEQAYALCLLMHQEATKRHEPTTVLRWSDAVPPPEQPKERERPKGNKRREHA